MSGQVCNVPTFYIMQFSNVLAELGLSLSDCLCALDAEIQTLSTPNAVMPSDTFDALISHLVCDKEIASPGLLLGNALKPIHHGSFGLAIMNSPTGLDSLRLVQRFISLLIPGITLKVSETKQEIVVAVFDEYWTQASHRFFIDALTAAFANLQRSIVEAGNCPIIKQFSFDYPNFDETLIQRICGDITYRFSQPVCSVVLDKCSATAPLKGSDPVSYEYAVALCEKERERLSQDKVKSKLRCYFEKNLNAFPSLTEAASALNMSKRTLHRQLLKEGTNFKCERDAFLKLRAYELLHVRKMSVRQVAEELGYADPSNFRRAFVSWFKVPPSKYK
ncbi:helix-turn-helix domain-containing protein [Alteromonas gracilis]|uniref:AraC family transcriptional regulator n=1 Tax=Alteromonas gracilis TaxID=1479524 RepID=UPI00373542B2